MKMKWPPILVLSSMLLVSPPALSQGIDEGAWTDQESHLSLTISPIHLVLPLLELTGEYAITPQLGFALIGGFGSYEFDSTTTGTLWEIGGSLRYYALGDFEHGMQVGAEVSHLGLSVDTNESGLDLSASGAGTSLGGFLGYKFIAAIGFTIDIQVGYEIGFISAEVSSSDGTNPQGDEETTEGVLLNLNAGWSF